MGNFIELFNGSNVSIHLSNGATSTFITIIGLSGSKLAKTETEKRLIVWIMEKDQSKVGIGSVGISVSEMPWTKDDFENEKSFLLDVISAAKQKLGWDTLNYNPNEEIIFSVLDDFGDMIKQFESECIDDAAINEWLEASDKTDPIFNNFPLCKKHKILLSCFGCHACNDN